MPEHEHQEFLVLRAGFVNPEEYAAGEGRRLTVNPALRVGRLTYIGAACAGGYLLNVFDRTLGEFVTRVLDGPAGSECYVWLSFYDVSEEQVRCCCAAAPILVNLRDGTTGTGTILWSSYINVPATAAQAVTINVATNIVGSSNTAMNLEFAAAGGANSYESVALVGMLTQ